MTTTTADSIETAHEDQGRPAPSYDDINAPVIILVAVISALLTFLTIALVQGMFYHWQASYLQKRELQFETVNPPAKMEILDQQTLLDGSMEGTTSIEKAMQQVIAEYSSGTTTEASPTLAETPAVTAPPTQPKDDEHHD